LVQKGDFDSLGLKLNLLTQKGYLAFVKDFGLQLDTGKIVEVWKKSSVNHQPHDFETFEASLVKLGQAMNAQKTEQSKKKVLQIKKLTKLREANTELAKIKQSGISRDFIGLKDEELQEEKSKLIKLCKSYAEMKPEDCQKQVLDEMELHDPEKFRSKMKGYEKEVMTQNISQTKKLMGRNYEGAAGGRKPSTQRPPIRPSQVSLMSKDSGSISDVVLPLPPLPPPKRINKREMSSKTLINQETKALEMNKKTSEQGKGRSSDLNLMDGRLNRNEQRISRQSDAGHGLGSKNSRALSTNSGRDFLS